MYRRRPKPIAADRKFAGDFQPSTLVLLRVLYLCAGICGTPQDNSAFHPSGVGKSSTYMTLSSCG